jgi:hypothetical protein
MSHSTLLKLARIGTFSLLILSCSFFENASSQVSTATGAANPDSPQTREDPRVQGTLALRSVQMVLETTFPGGTPKRILISIDADGNQKIELAIPLPEGSSDTSDFPEGNILEIFVIDGAAFSRMGKEGQAETSPEQIDALHRILYNPTGPGMWMMLLPKDAFSSTGIETKGGFEMQRYSIKASIEEGTVQGEIWVDKQTEALIGANLSVSESLFHAEGSGTSGSVSIILTVEKAEIAAITLP